MLSTVFGVGNGGSMAAEGGYAVNFNWINTHNLYYQRWERWIDGGRLRLRLHVQCLELL